MWFWVEILRKMVKNVGPKNILWSTTIIFFEFLYLSWDEVLQFLRWTKTELHLTSLIKMYFSWYNYNPNHLLKPNVELCMFITWLSALLLQILILVVSRDSKYIKSPWKHFYCFSSALGFCRINKPGRANVSWT